LTFRVTGDGKTLWTSATIDRYGAGQRCEVDIQGVKMLRLEVHSTGDNYGQRAVWLNPIVSARSEPPFPKFSRESRWTVEGGTEYKFSQTEKGMLLELVPGTNKVYSKIQIPLVKCGQSWAGIGDLYFRNLPSKRFEVKMEIASEDFFNSTS